MISRIICITLILAVLTGCIPVTLQAQGVSSPWMTSDPQIKEVQSSISETTIPKDCMPDTKFVTTPRNILKSQLEKSLTVCATVTPYGMLATHNGDLYFMKNNSSVAGIVKAPFVMRYYMGAIPNTNDVMYSTNEPLYGFYRRIIRNFPAQLATEPQGDGSIIYRIIQSAPSKTIDDLANYPINFSDTKFSNNGQWFIGNAHQRGIYRVNSSTGTTLNYGDKYNHANGTSPSFVSAISNDGRYVVETENRYGIFHMYDLATCVPKTNPADRATCQKKDLFSTVPQQIKNFRRVVRADFSTDYTIRLYVERTDNTRALYTMTAVGHTESLVDYMALGDSFASGEGAYSYKKGTDERDKNTCHLSNLSYPYLLPSRISLNTVQSIACSGAKMKDITSSEYPEHDAQSKGKNGNEYDPTIFQDYLPGYRPQWQFLQNNKPHNVTVSIGGNDIGFGSILTACIGAGTCYDTQQQKLNLNYTIAAQFPRLVDTYEKIKDQAQTSAHIYVTGYPYLAKEGGNCAQNVLLNSSEIQLSNQIIDYVNLVIKRATEKAGVTLLIPVTLFLAIDYVKQKSSDTAVNGLTAGDDKTFSFTIANKYSVEGYLTGRESYHPNQLGHRLLADAIAKQSNGFMHQNPAPLPVIVPTIEESKNITASTIMSLTPRRLLFDESIANSVIPKQTSTPLNIAGVATNSSVSILLNNTTISTHTANNTGTIHTSITLPAGLPIGPAILSAVALNTSQEPIEIQKVVYIAETEDDLDGDLIPNTDEACLLTTASKKDVDTDTLDDACDGYVDDPPDTLQISSPKEISKPNPTNITRITATPSIVSPYKDWRVIESSPYNPPQALGNVTPNSIRYNAIARHSPKRQLLFLIPVTPLVITILYFVTRNIRHKRLQ